MLTTKQLEYNKTRFKETNLKYGVFTKELEDFLGDEFYISPSSTTLNLFGCYPGGLLNITNNACKFAIHINSLLPESLRQPIDKIVKTVFLSQIGKVFSFCPNENEWQRKNLGKMYEYCNDVIRLRTGERSVYYASKFGVEMSEEVYQAILNLDKDNDDKMAKYFSETLTQIIKMGFDLSIMEDKKIMEEKNGKKGY